MRLKGPARPVNPVGDRAEVLSALEAVDHVIVFHADDSFALVTEIQPDVRVKGADLKDKGVIGGEIVEARESCLVLAPLLDGHSTTRTRGWLAARPEGAAPGERPPRPPGS